MMPTYFTRLLGDTARPNTPIQYIGSAISHFQAEPLMYDQDGKPCISSEWELEVLRRINNATSGIPKADVEALPRFLSKKHAYVQRSADLSENMFRFSFDFARLCPRAGEFNEKLMVEYVKTAALIRLHGMEPFVTLNHFTMPERLISLGRNGRIKRGAWEHPEVITHFRFYVENVARFLTDKDKTRSILKHLDIPKTLQENVLHSGLVRYFMTINEPAVILVNCYGIGNFPPYQHLRLLKMIHVLQRLREAHRISAAILREFLGDQQIQLGIGHNWQHFEGVGGKFLHVIQEYWTQLLEKEESDSDFLGMHYYFRRTIPIFRSEERKRDRSDQPTFGDIFPLGIRLVMERMHAKHPHKPLFISEIGFSDRTDLRRPFWLLETVRHILESWSAGVPVKGILHWSLVNNFEWDYGMSQKFGLFDEMEVAEPPTIRKGFIRSWQVWRAIVKGLRSPAPDTLQELDALYSAAHSQYRKVSDSIES